jgi:tRNA threonylcarbamoyladenosine biosynthesis protein TsaE
MNFGACWPRYWREGNGVKKSVESHSPGETRDLAAALLRELPERRIFALHGDLGSGKTCFVQGLADALGVTRAVTSPTYTLVNEYPAGSRRLVHMDLYRIARAADALEFGLDDYLDDPAAVVAVEWAERCEGLLPGNAVRLVFQNGNTPDTRRIRVEWE